VGEEQRGLLRVEAEVRAGLGARDRAEALQVDAHRQDGDAAGGPGSREVAAELARDGHRQRREREGRLRDPARAGVEEVVAVERHDDRPEAGGERGPGDEPEVRVDDVEAPAAVAAPKLAGGRGVGAQARREGEQLDLDVVAAAQRLDLVADERAQRRPLR
jgi:hypothetical protein